MLNLGTARVLDPGVIVDIGRHKHEKGVVLQLLDTICTVRKLIVVSRFGWVLFLLQGKVLCKAKCHYFFAVMGNFLNCH